MSSKLGLEQEESAARRHVAHEQNALTARAKELVVAALYSEQIFGVAVQAYVQGKHSSFCETLECSPA